MENFSCMNAILTSFINSIIYHIYWYVIKRIEIFIDITASYFDMFSHNYRIREIQTASPQGMAESRIDLYDEREWYVNISWTPGIGQAGPHLFCFTALDSNRWVKYLFYNILYYNKQRIYTYTFNCLAMWQIRVRLWSSDKYMLYSIL